MTETQKKITNRKHDTKARAGVTGNPLYGGTRWILTPPCSLAGVYMSHLRRLKRTNKLLTKKGKWECTFTGIISEVLKKTGVCGLLYDYLDIIRRKAFQRKLVWLKLETTTFFFEGLASTSTYGTANVSIRHLKQSPFGECSTLARARQKYIALVFSQATGMKWSSEPRQYYRSNSRSLTFTASGPPVVLVCIQNFPES